MKTCIIIIGDFRTSQPAICCHAAMQQHPWKPSLPPGTSHWIGKSLGHPTWISCETWFHGYETMASHNITANQQNKMGNCLPNVGFPWPVLGNVAPAPVWDTEAKNFSWVQQQIAFDRRWYFLGVPRKRETSRIWGNNQPNYMKPPKQWDGKHQSGHSVQTNPNHRCQVTPLDLPTCKL